jgi:hypothetical protein
MAFDNDLLQLYLNAIDIEKAREIRNLLPLYRLGLRTKEDVLAKLQVHTGNENTIRRYIVNKDTLTEQQLWCILSLYNIADLEGVEVVNFEDYLVVYVPTPEVLIAISEAIYEITKVPDVIVMLEERPSQVDIVLVPEPTIQLAIDEIIAEYEITLVPEPIVLLNTETGDEYTITFVPEVQVTLANNYDDYEITLVPEVQVSLGIFDIAVILYVPEVQVTLETEELPDDRIYYGISTDPARPAVADFSILTSELRSPVPDDLTIRYDGSVGYYILALPAAATVRRSWYVDEFNKGPIGGSWDDVFSNAWPDPILQMYGGKTYQVYIGSYATQFLNEVIFRTTPL